MTEAILFLPIGVTPCIRSPLWVEEAAVNDVKGFGENEGAQRPGIKSRKNKRRFRGTLELERPGP